MTNTPIQITTDLSTILERIERKIDRIDEKFESKLDSLQKEVTETKVAIEAVKGDIKGVQGDIKVLNEKVDGMDKRLEKVEASNASLVTDIADLKGTKSLIIPLIVAVTTSLLTLLIRAIPNP